jgi:hypothetical protein
MIIKALYIKYSASQNYFYQKEIDDLLAKKHTHLYIAFKDNQTWFDNDEYLKEYCSSLQLPFKLTELGEYYRVILDNSNIWRKVS